MRAYRKEQPDLIYESENRWMKVYFGVEDEMIAKIKSISKGTK